MAFKKLYSTLEVLFIAELHLVEVNKIYCFKTY